MMNQSWDRSIKVDDIDEAIRILSAKTLSRTEDKKAYDIAIAALNEQRKLYPTGELAEISKMMTFSDMHISQETRNMLKMADKGVVPELYGILVYSKGSHGWLIYVPGYEMPQVDAPEDIVRLLKIAQENDCTWLCIDEDGPEMAGIPKYE